MVRVSLELMTLNTTKREQFLYGSIIEGRKLKEALTQMSKADLKSAEDALFVQLAELMQTGQGPDVQKVHHHITKRPIFETGNQDGQRVYFMRFGRLQGIPVIIRIAAGNKKMFAQIFSEIAGEDTKTARKGGRL